MNIKERLPGIARAYIDMERDNGGINRHRTEDDALADLERYIEQDGLDVAMDLPAIDAYFASLSDDDLELVTSGEQIDREAFMANAPAGASAFLDAVFDHG